MTDSNLTKFNIAASLRMMDIILNKGDNAFIERDTIPSLESLTFDNGFYVNCAALCVDIRGSSELPRLHKRPVLAKLYRAYISEVTRLMTSCALCRHVRIVGDSVMGIFNIIKPASHMNEVFLLGAKISGLIHVLNDKLEQRSYTPIQVGIGMSYGRALMIKAGYSGSTINDTLWMGDVINETSNLGNLGSKQSGDGQFMLSQQVYEKLSDEHKRFMEQHAQYGCYHGSPQRNEMIELNDRIKRQRARSLAAPVNPPVPVYRPTPSVFFGAPTSSMEGGLFGLSGDRGRDTNSRASEILKTFTQFFDKKS